MTVRGTGPQADWLPRDEGPVTVVFGTLGYRNTVLRWIEHARRAGCRHYRIVCMDAELLRALRGAGEAARAVAFHELLPEAPRPDFNALPAHLRLKALTPLRVRLFRHLAASGCDFIHSDADALWLRDPRPWLMRQGGYDLLFSQGTTFPRPHYHRHRFVVCAGFFLSRANRRTRAFFERVGARVQTNPSDQHGMNTVLLRDRARRWRLQDPVPAVCRNGQWVRPPLERWFGAGARYALAHPVPRTFVNAACRLAAVDWIVASHDIIHGRFGGGLTAGVIPMRIVARGRFAQWDTPWVLHSSQNKVG